MDNKKECKCTQEETCKRMMNAGLQKAVEVLKELKPTQKMSDAIDRCKCAKGACESIINALEVYECPKLKKRAKKTLEILKEHGSYEQKEDAATKILVAEIEAFIQD